MRLLILFLASLSIPGALGQSFEDVEIDGFNMEELFSKYPEFDPRNYEDSTPLTRAELEKDWRAVLDQCGRSQLEGQEPSDHFFESRPDLVEAATRITSANILGRGSSDADPNSQWVLGIDRGPFSPVVLTKLQQAKTFGIVLRALIKYAEDLEIEPLEPSATRISGKAAFAALTQIEWLRDQFDPDTEEYAELDEAYEAGLRHQRLKAILPFLEKAVGTYTALKTLLTGRLGFVPDEDLLPRYQAIPSNPHPEKTLLQFLQDFSLVNPNSWWVKFFQNWEAWLAPVFHPDRDSGRNVNSIFIFALQIENQLNTLENYLQSAWNWDLIPIPVEVDLEIPAEIEPTSYQDSEVAWVTATNSMAWDLSLRSFVFRPAIKSAITLTQAMASYLDPNGPPPTIVRWFQARKSREWNTMLELAQLELKRTRSANPRISGKDHSPEKMAESCFRPGLSVSKETQGLRDRVFNLVPAVRKRSSARYKELRSQPDYDSNLKAKRTVDAEIRKATRGRRKLGKGEDGIPNYSGWTESDEAAYNSLYAEQQRLESLLYDEEFYELHAIRTFLNLNTKATAYSTVTALRMQVIADYFRDWLEGAAITHRLSDFSTIGLLYYFDLNRDGNIDQDDFDVFESILAAITKQPR